MLLLLLLFLLEKTLCCDRIWEDLVVHEMVKRLYQLQISHICHNLPHFLKIPINSNPQKEIVLVSIETKQFHDTALCGLTKLPNSTNKMPKKGQNTRTTKFSLQHFVNLTRANNIEKSSSKKAKLVAEAYKFATKPRLLLTSVCLIGFFG